jgi:hypothetical protein
MPVKAMDPGANPKGREPDLAGNDRNRLAVGTGPNGLRALHHPVRRRAGTRDPLQFLCFLRRQHSYLECHVPPSKPGLEGV